MLFGVAFGQTHECLSRAASFVNHNSIYCRLGLVSVASVPGTLVSFYIYANCEYVCVSVCAFVPPPNCAPRIVKFNFANNYEPGDERGEQPWQKCATGIANTAFLHPQKHQKAMNYLLSICLSGDGVPSEKVFAR